MNLTILSKNVQFLLFISYSFGAKIVYWSYNPYFVATYVKEQVVKALFKDSWTSNQTQLDTCLWGFYAWMIPNPVYHFWLISIQKSYCHLPKKTKLILILGNWSSNVSRMRLVPNLNILDMKLGILQCKKFWIIWPRLWSWTLFWMFFLDHITMKIFKATFNFVEEINKLIKYRIWLSILVCYVHWIVLLDLNNNLCFSF